MNTTNESLEELVRKGIIDSCNKHEEVIYFGALENCPVCTGIVKNATKLRKKVVEKPKNIEEPTEEVVKDTSIIGRMREFVQNPQNRGKVIFMVVAVLLLCWLYLNSAAIMSYFG
jgi:hypothetical protein